MGLNVAPPDPPRLSGVDPNEYEDATVQGDDYHKEELQTFLEEGAWERSFDEWAEQTDLSEDEFAIAEDLGLFERFDFFWDDFADRVGFHAPGIPEDWRERGYHSDLDSWEAVSSINASLTEFGQLVSEVLADEYVDWEAEYQPPEDLPDFE